MELEPAAQAHQRASGPKDVPDAVEQPSPAAQGPGVGQMADRLLHQGAQPCLHAVIGPLPVGEPPDAAGGYLAQPDMRALIQAALALGWTLWRYEAAFDHAPAALVEQGLMSQAFSNWREAEQARNLAAVLAGLAASDRLLVWCGNGHANKVAGEDWRSMGYQFAALVAEGAFVIDQTVTVAFAGLEEQRTALVAELAPVLDRYGGTAGLLREEAGPLSCWPGWTR